MSTLTDRLPDDTPERLKELARDRGESVNRLTEELSMIAITQHDAETRYRALAGGMGAGWRGVLGRAHVDRGAARVAGEAERRLASGI